MKNEEQLVFRILDRFADATPPTKSEIESRFSDYPDDIKGLQINGVLLPPEKRKHVDIAPLTIFEVNPSEIRWILPTYLLTALAATNPSEEEGAYIDLLFDFLTFSDLSDDDEIPHAVLVNSNTWYAASLGELKELDRQLIKEILEVMSERGGITSPRAQEALLSNLSKGLSFGCGDGSDNRRGRD